MSEFRKDPVQSRWVIIDPDCPVDDKSLYSVDVPEDLPAHDPDCPFCPGRESTSGPDLLRYNFIPKEKIDYLMKKLLYYLYEFLKKLYLKLFH